MPPPTTTDDLFEQAVAAHQAGRTRQAEILYRQVIAQDPTHPDALHLLGLVVLPDSPDAALDLITRAIASDAAVPIYHASLGQALAAVGHSADAIAAYRRALTMAAAAPPVPPEFAAVHVNLGLALQAADQNDQSIAEFRRAIELRPDFAEAHNNLGTALGTAGQLADALVCLRRAVALRPDSHQVWTNLANVLLRSDHPDQAVAAVEQALRLQPRFYEAHMTLAISHLAQNHLDDTIRAFQQAIEIAPDAPLSHWNLGLALLLAGRWPEGFREYEWRWTNPGPRGIHRDFPCPRWDGRNLAGKTILLHNDQGFGDTIHFARYVSHVARQGGKIIFEVQPHLTRLFQNQFQDTTVISQGETLPPFDFQSPLLDLARLTNTTPHAVPADVPYVRADTTLARQWQSRVAAAAPADLKVGLVWAGRSRPDHHRTIGLAPLALLADIPSVKFFSLQKLDPGSPAPPPADFPLIDLTGYLYDFADTAALIANLDLVITIDSAVAHLAGAMAKPTWLLLPFAPDWRWLLDRPDSPWYPTMRLFRQPKIGDWQTPVSEIAAALRASSARIKR